MSAPSARRDRRPGNEAGKGGATASDSTQKSAICGSMAKPAAAWGAGVHSGPSGVAPLIDGALKRASERCRTAGFDVMILQRHDSTAVLGFGYEPAAIRR